MAADLTPGEVDALLAQSGNWPHQQGITEFIAALRALQARQAARTGANGANLAAAAGAYAGADKTNAKGLALKEIGLGEVGQFVGAFIQPLAQLSSAGLASGSQLLAYAASVVGTLTSATLQPLTGVVGAVTSANIQHPAEHIGNPTVGPSAADLQTPDGPAPALHPVHVRNDVHPAR